MKYNGIIQRKLSLLDDQIQKLKQHTSGLSLDSFKDDWVIRSMSERAIQVCVEIIIDIAERIIALEHAGPVATAGEAIEKLHVLGIISSAEPYRAMIGLRNIIVHQYEAVDPGILFSVITTKLDNLSQFRDELDKL